MKRQKWSIGAFIKIPLRDGLFALGRLLESPHIAFYDSFFSSEASINFESLEIAFTTCVYTDIISKGKWAIVKVEALNGSLTSPPIYFKYDQISHKFSLYAEGKESPSTKETCRNYERLSVWDENHIVDRLMDLKNGVPNKWRESLREPL